MNIIVERENFQVDSFGPDDGLDTVWRNEDGVLEVKSADGNNIAWVKDWLKVRFEYEKGDAK